MLDAKLLPATITRVRQITVSYPSVDCSVRYSSVTIAYTWLQSLWQITFFPQPEVGWWPSDIGSYYDRPTIATAGPLYFISISNYHSIVLKNVGLSGFKNL